MILYSVERKKEDSSHKIAYEVRNKATEEKLEFAFTFHKLSLKNNKHLCLKDVSDAFSPCSTPYISPKLSPTALGMCN